MPARPAPRPADPRLTAHQIACRCAAGLVTGQLLVVVIDRLIGGPGPFAVLGL